MPHPAGSTDWLLNDLAAIEALIGRSTHSDLPAGNALDFHDKRYRHLVENSLGLICTHDLDGTVLSVNPAAASSLGYEPRDGIGRNLSEFLSPKTRHLFAEYLARIRANGHDSGLMAIIRRDGTERLWLYRNVLYSELDAQPYVLGHALDVTERASAEATLRMGNTETLEATARVSGRVAHAFNNLLTVVLGNSELLLSDPHLVPQWRPQIESIVRAASRGAGVTRKLLAVSGQQVIERTAVDLNGIVDGLETQFHQLAGPDIVISLVLDPTLPKVQGDARQIEQILLHLVANARDAMPGGGEITIQTWDDSTDAARTPRVGDDASDRYPRLTVRDTGRGMDAMTKAHILEPFFTTKSEGLDVGLGLAIVYGVVHQLGGSISIESQLGRGTTFTLAFPRAPARYAEQGVETAGNTSGAVQQTIALVDDEEDVRSVMRALLRKEGYAVLEAASGEDAIQTLESHSGPVHMLLTDVVMPGMTGCELFERVARRYPGLKVLYVSGYPNDALDCVRSGTDYFLAKPFPLETLAKKVRDILDAPRRVRAVI